jgi:hypothetical protein
VLVKQVSAQAQDDVPPVNKVKVHCVDFLAFDTIKYTFGLSDEMRISLTDGGVKRYLYEPDVTLMKVQAFSSLCARYPVQQLDVDTHLMTSDELIADFPGRIFEVEGQMPFTSKLLKSLKKTVPQANIATRNFILTADALRKKTGIKDGGDVYLFGAKVKDIGNQLLKCRKRE